MVVQGRSGAEPEVTGGGDADPAANAGRDEQGAGREFTVPRGPAAGAVGRFCTRTLGRGARAKSPGARGPCPGRARCSPTAAQASSLSQSDSKSVGARTCVCSRACVRVHVSVQVLEKGTRGGPSSSGLPPGPERHGLQAWACLPLWSADQVGGCLSQ